MLIVCANLAHLQMARMGPRQKEMAIRAALGAGRFRLLRQVLTESIILSCCGAALGLFLAVAGTRASRISMPSTFLCSKAFGSMAARWSSPCWPRSLRVWSSACCPRYRYRALAPRGHQDASRESSGGRRHAWFGDGLVISNFALACILLVGAGLLIRSFLRVLDVNLGFQPERAAVRGSIRAFASPVPRNRTLLSTMCCIVPALSPAFSRQGSPTSCRSMGTGVLASLGSRTGLWQGHHHPEAFIRVVSDGYLTPGIALRSGREFTESDRASGEHVVVINETLARTLWPARTRWDSW